MGTAYTFQEETIRTGGKINLFLFITGRRENGYHELATLFVRLPEPQDTLIFRPSSHGEGVQVHCDVPGIDPASNTLTKAWRLYAEATGFAPALNVELIKGIPHGAGLGGGSADGAEVLAWLQRHAPEPLCSEKLNEIAARVGADVPFFLQEGPCLAEGIGDKLTPFDPGLNGRYGLLLCPGVHVDTAWAYAAWDAERASFPLTEKTKADKYNRSSCQTFYGRNDFETVVFGAHPVLSALKEQLLQCGADIAGMSGSGSSLFGLFQSRELAVRAVEHFRKGKDAPEVYGPFSF